MKRSVLAFASTVVLLAGCEGFREAMTAHVDVVARAESQELSVERLANLMGGSRIPATEENARTLADLWVNYQLLATAAARGDSLTDPKLVDEALWPIIAQQRAQKFHEQVSRSWTVDTNVTEATYAQGNVLAAQHILFPVPDASKDDSVRRVAEAVRARATGANFAQLARQHSGDPGSAERGGIYPAFPRGTMVPEFEQSVLSLQPGEIAPGLVKTQFGYHIIRRPTFAEVRPEYSEAAARQGMVAAESTFLAKLTDGGKIQFRKDAAASIRKVIADVDDARDDNTVIATTSAGDFTARKLARWIGAFPPQQQMMLRAQTQQAPDSLLTDFVKRQFIQNELILHAADSAKVNLSPEELTRLRGQFAVLVERTMGALGLSPKTLADSAKTVEERERVAAAHVDRYMEALLNNQAQFVEIPVPLQDVLREKYDAKVNAAGIDRAFERAQQIRARADSAARAARPQTQVPIAPPAGQPAPQGAPQGTQPQQAQPQQPQQPAPQQP